jgi:hypothetical protein
VGAMRRLLLKASRSRGVTGRHSLCGQLDFTVERPQHWHQWSRSQIDSPLSEELHADVGATGNRRCRAAGGVGPEQSWQRGDQHQPCGQGEVSIRRTGRVGRDWKFLLQSMAIRGRKGSPFPTAKDHWVTGGSGTTKGSHPPRSVPGRPLGFKWLAVQDGSVPPRPGFTLHHS